MLRKKIDFAPRASFPLRRDGAKKKNFIVQPWDLNHAAQ